MSFDISPLLDIAWAILQFTLDYVWVFCLLAFAMVLVKTLLDLSKRTLGVGGQKGQ